MIDMIKTDSTYVLNRGLNQGPTVVKCDGLNATQWSRRALTKLTKSRQALLTHFARRDGCCHCLVGARGTIIL